MNEDVEIDVIECIVFDIIDQLPNSILEFYRNIPGRNPSEHSKNLGRIAGMLSDNDARLLIRDIVDGSLFSVLSLIDQKFKDYNIRTDFSRGGMSQGTEGSLHERYRMRVDPGGILIDKSLG